MSKRKVFGPANEFYRVRFMCIFEVSPEELNWEEGLGIYRQIKSPEVEQDIHYEVQIIDLNSSDVIKKFVFKDDSEAKLKYDSLIDDLNSMEKGEFDAKYKISS